MSATATLAKSRIVPPLLGVGTLVLAILVIELLTRAGLINRFIVPLPSEIVEAFPRVIINVGRSFTLTASQQFLKILFPAALPTVFVGLRLGLIFSLINIVGVEFLINFGGLGQLINELAERYDLPGTYAAICFVVLVSICVFIILERLERWLRPAD